MSRPSDPNAKIKLLTAAEAEFVEKGLDRAKVEGITARAGLSKGAFYLHFASKEDAFRQLVETTLARLARFVDDIPREEMGGLPWDDMDAVFDFWVEKDAEVFEFVWQNRGVMALLLGGGSSRDYRYLMDEFAERTRRSIAQGLTIGAEHGMYRDDVDIELASVFLAGAYDRFARQIVTLTKKPDLRAALRKMQLMVLRGIGSDAVLEHTDPRVTETIAPAENRGPAHASTPAAR